MSTFRVQALLPALSLLALVAARSDASALYGYTDLGGVDPVAINASGTVLLNPPYGTFGPSAVYTGYGPEAGRVAAIPGSFISYGINDRGQVVGSTRNGDAYQAEPVTADGTTNYGAVAAPGYLPRAINDSGQVAGYVESHAYLQGSGARVDLGFGYAFAINAFGQVTGNGAENRAFLYSAGRMTDLGTLAGGDSSIGFAINASGQVAGMSTAAGGISYRPFLYRDGVMTDLGTLGDDHGAATAINASGQVVGNSGISPGVTHAFLYSDGVLHDLNALLPPGLGWTLISASGINDAGQIIGAAEDASGQVRGYLLTPGGMAPPTPPPIPEPATVAVFGLAAVGLALRAAAKRRRAA